MVECRRADGASIWVKDGGAAAIPSVEAGQFWCRILDHTMATSCCGATRISAHPLMEKWCDARIRASEEGERIPVLPPLPAPCAEAPTSVVAAMAWGRASCKTGALQFLPLWHLCTLLFANHGDCSSRCATTTKWNAEPGEQSPEVFWMAEMLSVEGWGKAWQGANVCKLTAYTHQKDQRRESSS